MKMKRLISFVIVLLLICGMPVSAFADTWYVDDGNITVNATESGQTVSQGETTTPDDAPVITQRNSSTPTTNTVTINAAENAEANVTLSGVNIYPGDTEGFGIQTTGAGDVFIELDGTNIVVSGDINAALEKNNDGNLTIADSNGDGSLTAIGYTGGAGIGGAGDKSADNITITGGIIDASSTSGAGIGGGYNGSGSNITISGGDVKATGGNGGAGIGGGLGGDGSDITISGSAEVTANGGSGGAGIGGGWCGDGSNITISGSAEVTAKGDLSGAGIGGGNLGSGSKITISGSAEVTATGGSDGAGIGGGLGGDGSNITISGSAEVTAKGDLSGAGIGGGYNGSGSNITITEDAQVKAQGSINNNSYATGAAIGNGGKDNDVIGDEVEPNTYGLTPNGKIEYYAPGADINNATPYKTVTGTYVPSQDEEKPPEEKPPLDEEAVYSAPLYRVIDQDGEDIPYKAEQRSGVLTITVDADFASLTGKLCGIQTLKAQGIDTIVFVTNGASSAFALSDLLAQGSTGDSYTLNHNGDTVSFTLGEAKTDINEILAQP